MMEEALARARLSLLGLSVGDAFGETMAAPGAAKRITKRLLLRERPWRWTDDTAMAIDVVEVLARRGTCDPDALAAAFVRRWQADPRRGYGLGTAQLLELLARGGDWRVLSRAQFGGTGSWGNGAAMRAAPIGAYFAPDLPRVRAEALRSAEPTHAHPDGAAGAAAVAIAAALAVAGTGDRALLEQTAQWTPEGPTRRGLVRALELGLDFEVQLAGEELGTGCRISARDTVPFCVWVAARHLRHGPAGAYEEAVWTAASEVGDSDTNAAIVGGIVACATGLAGIPVLWREATEPLPRSQGRSELPPAGC